MKTFITLFALFLSTSSFAQSKANPTHFTYNCECSTGACEAQEHLNFLVDGAQKLKILLGDEEWEFTASLRGKKSAKTTPPATTRYEVGASADYDAKFSLVLDNRILNGWTLANAGSKFSKMLYLDQKTSKVIATYACHAEEDDFWVYNP